MELKNSPLVYTKDGLRGRLDPPSQTLDGSQSQVAIRMENGVKAFVPLDLLERREDGSYHLQVDLASLKHYETRETASSATLPVLEEQVKIEKRHIETGRVRVHKQVHEQEVLVDEPIYEEQVEIERVKVNRELQEPASPHQDGDTLIVPIMEEVLVVEKRLMLKEELRITRRRVEIRNPQRVLLHKEEAVVERLEPETGSPD